MRRQPRRDEGRQAILVGSSVRIDFFRNEPTVQMEWLDRNLVTEGLLVGDCSAFSSSRQLAAWLGVVPAQRSSDGKPRLGTITEHGNPTLRTLLVTGARSAVQTAHLRTDALSRCLHALRERRGWQKACVAPVNENLRIAWAMLTRGECLDANHRPALAQRKMPATSTP